MFWLPEFSFVDPVTGEDKQGWFRSGCSGTTYRMSGERVFGPGQRDMDRFPLEIRQLEDGDAGRVEVIQVDTRQLICARSASASSSCERAPLPQ